MSTTKKPDDIPSVVSASIQLQQQSASNISSLVDKKLEFFQDVIQKTIIHVNRNKVMDILGVGDVNMCINTLNTLSDKIKALASNQPNQTEQIIQGLQIINNELSGILKMYGTESLDDLLTICYGSNNSTPPLNEHETTKFDLLKKYFHPTSYRVVIPKIPGLESSTAESADTTTANPTTHSKSKKIVFADDMPHEPIKNLDCIDISLHMKPFYLKVHGKIIHIQYFFKNHFVNYGHCRRHCY